MMNTRDGDDDDDDDDVDDDGDEDDDDGEDDEMMIRGRVGMVASCAALSREYGRRGPRCCCWSY